MAFKLLIELAMVISSSRVL